MRSKQNKPVPAQLLLEHSRPKLPTRMRVASCILLSDASNFRLSDQAVLQGFPSRPSCLPAHQSFLLQT